MRRSPVLLLLSLVLASASCGGGGGPASPSTQPINQPANPGGSASTSASVSMATSTDSYGYETSSFQPGLVTIKAGGNVTWTYHGSVIHNATFSPAAGSPANVPNGRNGSVSRSFPTVGEFDYSCTNHAGMDGTVRVVP